MAATPEVAVPTLNWLLDSEHILAAVITQPDRPAGRGRELKESVISEWARENSVPCFKPANVAETALLVKDCDLLLTIGYGVLLPAEILGLPHHGCLNLHFSLLPRWRGAAPVQRAIEAGDSLSGVTVFALDPGMDTGPIYLMQSIQIESSERSEELLERLSILGSSLTLDSLTLISDGFTPQAQSAQGVSIAPKFKKSDGQLDWSQSSEQIFNRYRALSDNPGVWSMLADLRIKIDSLRPSYASDQLKPGEILIDSEKFFVGTSTNVIEIVRLTPAGRNQMSAAEFIRGLPSRSGLSLG